MVGDHRVRELGSFVEIGWRLQVVRHESAPCLAIDRQHRPPPIPLGSCSEGVAVAGVRHHHILPTPLIRFERTKRSPLTTVSVGPMRRSRQDELAKRQWPTAAAPEFSPRPTNTPSTAPTAAADAGTTTVCGPSMNAVPVSRDRRRETPAPPALWRGHSGGDRLGCASGFREPDGFTQPLTQPRKPGRWVYLAAAAVTTLVPPLLGPAQLRTQGGDFGGQNVGEQRRLRDVARTIERTWLPPSSCGSVSLSSAASSPSTNN